MGLRTKGLSSKVFIASLICSNLSIKTLLSSFYSIPPDFLSQEDIIIIYGLSIKLLYNFREITGCNSEMPQEMIDRIGHKNI